MKKITLLICFGLISLIAQAQWIEQNPLPTALRLNSVYFVDANIGFAVGIDGNLLKTIDGGATWTSTAIVDVNLISVYFSDASTGFAWSSNDLNQGSYSAKFKTIDGGATWTGEDFEGTPEWSPSFYYIDSNTGYQVGDRGIILKTTDGGTTWNSLTSGTTKKLNSVFFTDANVGYVVGGWECCPDYGEYEPYAIILKTVNAGATWDTLSSGTNTPLNSVFFTDANTGYAVGGIDGHWPPRAVILKTTNGGITWSTLSGGITNSDLFAVYFTDANNGYAVGSGGTIIKTNNGGTNWNTLFSGTNSDLGSVNFTDNNTGYAIGNGITLKTINGGTTWNIHSEMGGSSVYFFDANTWYAWYSMEKSIIKTTDGGTTWSDLSIGTTNNISSFYFVDVNTGYAAGSASISDTTKGIILKTLNGGASWTSVYNTGFLSDNEFWSEVNSIYFIDADTGFAYGVIQGAEYRKTQISLKTIDGGATWNDFQSETIYPWRTFNTVYYEDTTIWYGILYPLGSIGVPDPAGILKTIDKGKTWTSSFIKQAVKINSIYFPNANTGYVVGNCGLILKTTNGGGVVSIKEPQTLVPLSIFTLYPNPASHKINITTTGNLQGETQISIYSINGSKIRTHKFQNTHTFELDVSTMAKGIYLLQLQSFEGVETQKLVVQ